METLSVKRKEVIETPCIFCSRYFLKFLVLWFLQYIYKYILKRGVHSTLTSRTLSLVHLVCTFGSSNRGLFATEHFVTSLLQRD